MTLSSKMSIIQSEVLIVGGGPAGSACGIVTARAGLKTLVIEKGDLNREKICGDGLIPDAHRALEHLGVFDEVKKRGLAISKVRIHGRGKTEFIVDAPLLTLQRRELDKILRDQVKREGGEVQYNTLIVKIDIQNERVELTDSKGNTYLGKVLVLATGANTRLAQNLGFEFCTKAVVSLRGYMPNTGNVTEYCMWFDSDMAPAYGWVFPCPGNLINVGVYLGTDKKIASAKDVLADFISTKARRVINDAVFIEPPKGWSLRTGLRRDNNYSDRVLLVGENADTTYALVGEGVGKALESGILAGKTIIQAQGDYGHEQLQIYQKMLLESMAAPHNAYIQARYLLESGVGNFVFSHLLSNSSNARRILSAIIREESSAKELFSVRGLVRQLVYWV